MDAKLPLPGAAKTPKTRPPTRVLLVAALLLYVLLHAALNVRSQARIDSRVRVPFHAQEALDKCNAIRFKPGMPEDFYTRTVSDRFVPGTKAVLIKHATVWTGENNGRSVLRNATVLLENGIIKDVAVTLGLDYINSHHLVVYDAQGAWLTPGIVDMHSHLGVSSKPQLSGASDGNSRHGAVQPWLRSLDGLNTHDDSYALSVAGGVTTSLVLPGSANSIGGQAFAIKLRHTEARTPTSMLLEVPGSENSTGWRQMKHACGENPMRRYGNTRMDNIAGLRLAYDRARRLMLAQDAFCASAEAGRWADIEGKAFPDDLQWEALVDVVRGRVKVHNHCYETVDLDDMVRMTNEFKFPIAAFHHAHETYLVPDTLKKAYGGPPAIAMFATNARYKRESYRGSEFAPKVLAEEGLRVVMKSDHPVLNSRHLLYEAQQAHYYGLPEHLAMASVMSTPASVMGYGHRIGSIKQGYDADIVLWDSHPLTLGATPQQVWIDGIPQLENSAARPALKRPKFQKAPKTPNFDKEANDTLKHDGLPPLEPARSRTGIVAFTNVKSVYTGAEEQSGHPAVVEAMSVPDGEPLGVALVRDGALLCAGSRRECFEDTLCAGEQHCVERALADVEVVDLEGGSLAPGLVSVGSLLGLEEIRGEASTQDGYILDPLIGPMPEIIGGEYSVGKAVDGLLFATRDALIAYRSGVTTAVVAPKGAGFMQGVSTVFSTGAAHALAKGAVLQREAAVYVALSHSGMAPSVSTQILALRRLLTGHAEGEAGEVFEAVAQGKAPLVVEVYSADIMATLLKLKQEVEAKSGKKIKMTFMGALEAHLLAKEIAHADVGVILSPARPFPQTWERRRILPGPPLTEHSSVSLLLSHKVTVGLGVQQQWEARNGRNDVAWAALESKTRLSKAKALALGSTNIQKLLGIATDSGLVDLVATRGGDLLDMESKVVAIVSPRTRSVDIL